MNRQQLTKLKCNIVRSWGTQKSITLETLLIKIAFVESSILKTCSTVKYPPSSVAKTALRFHERFYYDNFLQRGSNPTLLRTASCP